LSTNQRHFRINEETVTESLEKEAVAVVENYFKAGIKVADKKTQTTRFSLVSVIVDTEGCSAEPGSVFDVTIEEAPKTLSKLLKNAPGVPRVAYLYHYRCSSSNSPVTGC
jgi:hypothetical protein